MEVEVFALVTGFLMPEPRKAIITRKQEDGYYCVGTDFFFTTDKESIIEWYEKE